jgi:hypothetical protein
LLYDTQGRAATQFWSRARGTPPSNHINLLSDNGRTHCLKKNMLGRFPIVECTGMLCMGAMRCTESLLTLTGEVCKEKTLLAAAKRTELFYHL